jgi:O-6-methylguanine DNA methyltransferase
MKIEFISRADTSSRTARHGMIETPFGAAHIAVTGQSLCWLFFPQDNSALERLRRAWKGPLVEESTGLQAMADAVFAGRSMPMVMAGTPFQHRVWQALVEISPGETVSYGELARSIGMPKSARAIGSAVGANPIAYLVPCHRVLAADGSLHGFACGLELKDRFLTAEGYKRAA